MKYDPLRPTYNNPSTAINPDDWDLKNKQPQQQLYPQQQQQRQQQQDFLNSIQNVNAKEGKKNLQKLFSNWDLDERTLYWLWTYCIKEGYFMDESVPFNSDLMFVAIERILSSSSSKKGELEKLRQETYLRLEEFKWIDEEGRQPTYLLQLVIKKLGLHLKLVEELTLKQKLVAYFDSLPDRIEVKKGHLDFLKKEWVNRQSLDKKLAWYGLSNERQRCETAWDWYRDRRDSVRLMSSVPEFKTKEDVFLFLDSTEFSDEEKLYHLSEIKKKYKSWQTQNNNIKQGKKPTNLSLSYESRDQLSGLAKKEGKTMSEMVEHLIKEAYASGG